MSIHEIKTPILKTVEIGLMSVFSEAVNGTADVKQGNIAVSTGREVRRGYETDLKMRLAKARLEEIESSKEQIVT